MSRKTSQLQIRVSPEQKQVLKRLAADAGLSVSEYVLSTVLPSSRLAFARRIEALRVHRDRPRAVADLVSFLSELSPQDFGRTTADPAIDGFPVVLQNYVAAAVEQAAHERGLAPPAWVRRVAAPVKPHFAWEVRSLRPHLMRITPLTFKRRNLFVDAAGIEGS